MDLEMSREELKESLTLYLLNLKKQKMFDEENGVVNGELLAMIKMGDEFYSYIK